MEEFDAPPSVTESSVLPPLVSDGSHLSQRCTFSVNLGLYVLHPGGREHVNSAGVPQVQVQVQVHLSQRSTFSVNLGYTRGGPVNSADVSK